MKSHKIDYHETLTSQMMRLGYHSDDQGICAAVADLGIEDFLRGKIARFSATVDYAVMTQNLAEQNAVMIQSIAKQRKKLNRKRKKHNPLTESKDNKSDQAKIVYTEDQLKLLNVLALFDEFELYADEQKATEFIGKSKSLSGPSMHTLRKFLAPEHKDDVMENAAWLNEFSFAGLNKYFENLYRILCASPVNLVIAISFKSHKIAIFYEGKSKKMFVINANQSPVVLPKKAEQLGKTVFNASAPSYGPIIPATFPAIFYSTLLTTRENMATVKPIIEKLKLLKGSYWDDAKASFPEKKGRDLPKTVDGMDLLFYAVKYNLTEVVRHLLKTREVDLNLPYPKLDLNICEVAALSNCVEFFDVLHELKMVDRIKDSPLLVSAVIKNEDTRIFDKLFRARFFDKVDPMVLLKSVLEQERKGGAQIFGQLLNAGKFVELQVTELLSQTIFHGNQEVFDQLMEMKMLDRVEDPYKLLEECMFFNKSDFFKRLIPLLDKINESERYQLVFLALCASKANTVFNELLDLPIIQKSINEVQWMELLHEAMYKNHPEKLEKLLHFIPESQNDPKPFLDRILVSIKQRDDNEILNYLIIMKKKFGTEFLLGIKDNDGKRLVDLAFKNKKENAFKFLANLHFRAFDDKLQKLIDHPELKDENLKAKFKAIQDKTSALFFKNDENDHIDKSVDFGGHQSFYEHEDSLNSQLKDLISMSDAKLSQISLLAGSPEKKQDGKAPSLNAPKKTIS